MSDQIELIYKKLKLAQDLSDALIRRIGLKLICKKSNGLFEPPTKEEVAKYLNGLAENNKVKHYRLENINGQNVILFNPDDLTEEDIKITQIEIQKTPSVIKVHCFDQPICSTDSVPYEISRIENLFRMPDNYESGTVVYFLCQTGKVVYVGQSINLTQRIQAHQSNKDFDSVYYIRVPMNKLTEVEHSLIELLKPKYNTFQRTQGLETLRPIGEQILN